jgi:hypothetical protein
VEWFAATAVKAYEPVAPTDVPVLRAVISRLRESYRSRRKSDVEKSLSGPPHEDFKAPEQIRDPLTPKKGVIPLLFYIFGDNK